MEPLAEGQTKDGEFVGVIVIVLTEPDSVMVTGALLASVTIIDALLALVPVVSALLGIRENSVSKNVDDEVTVFEDGSPS